MAFSPVDEQWSDADSEALERADRDLGRAFGQARAPLPVLRESLDAMMTSLGVPTDTSVTEITAGGVEAQRVSAAPVDDGAVLIWLHGGGYVIGSAQGYRGVAASVSAACGIPVVVPEYRLAPEHPYPAALEDAHAVMEWAADSFGDRWVLAGDSAGGGLTIASLLRARDEARPLPAAAVAVSPLADFTASGASFDLHADTDVAISRRSIQSLGHAYLQGHDPRDPLVSPVFGTLDRLPPTLIMASDREVLLDDARMLHTAMQRDGTSSTLSVYSGVPHAWTMFASYMPRAQRGVQEIGAFVRDALRA